MAADDLEHMPEPDKPLDPHDDARVGYRSPPKKHQFKPGQSGNPRGRPRGARRQDSLAVQVTRELERKVPVMENGRKKLVPAGVVVARSLVKQATANARSAKLVLELDAQGRKEIAAQPDRSVDSIREWLNEQSPEELMLLRPFVAKFVK